MEKKLDAYTELRVQKEISPEEYAEYIEPPKLQLDQIRNEEPELEAAMDWLKIQYLSGDSVLVKRLECRLVAKRCSYIFGGMRRFNHWLGK